MSTTATNNMIVQCYSQEFGTQRERLSPPPQSDQAASCCILPPETLQDNGLRMQELPHFTRSLSCEEPAANPVDLDTHCNSQHSLQQPTLTAARPRITATNMYCNTPNTRCDTPSMHCDIPNIHCNIDTKWANR